VEVFLEKEIIMINAKIMQKLFKNLLLFKYLLKNIYKL